MLLSSERGQINSPGWKIGVSAKLVKADLCGAKIEVVNSNNKTLIGMTGIVAKES